jgi:1,4-dihydroxy-2-naphthoate octaprenyltransferase
MRWQIQRTTYFTPEVFNWRIFSFAIITTLGLQILSNFANDYGDGIKGTDNEDREGQKGDSKWRNYSKEMKGAIIITSLLTLLSAILLIYFAFEDTNLYYSHFI